MSDLIEKEKPRGAWLGAGFVYSYRSRWLAAGPREGGGTDCVGPWSRDLRHGVMGHLRLGRFRLTPEAGLLTRFDSRAS